MRLSSYGYHPISIRIAVFPKDHVVARWPMYRPVVNNVLIIIIDDQETGHVLILDVRPCSQINSCLMFGVSALSLRFQFIIAYASDPGRLTE